MAIMVSRQILNCARVMCSALRDGLLDVIEVRLMCVGGGPTLDFADASAFLAGFQPLIDMALKRRLQ
jgi:hypothetical protein